ncbi:MAG: ankyrin repeat domain-containing protein [Deltaproteobacteria bacterium]|nr:ankyrin repeat domain-containing protein [Deltaproteobacteria bacterium]
MTPPFVAVLATLGPLLVHQVALAASPAAPETVTASHILIMTRPSDTADERAAKKARAEAVRQRLLAGEDFARLARETSDCPSKEQGGDLGEFRRSAMVKPFADAAFSQAAGAIGPVVETQFGYHIIKVNRRNLAEAAASSTPAPSAPPSRPDKPFTKQDLVQAALTGDVAGVRAALAAGVPVGATNPVGMRALDSAAQAGHLEVVRVLLGAGADANATGSLGYTALTVAAMKGRTEAVRLLLASKARVDPKAIDGSTPLMMAALNGHLDIVRLLIRAGADVNVHDQRNLTPLIVARRTNHAAVAEALVAAGAR